jgi:VanZ family protein
VGSGIVVAVGDEFLQSFVPGRESTASDVAADALGLALAQLLFARRKA